MEFKGTKGKWITRISGYKDYVCVAPENQQMDFLYYKGFNPNSPFFEEERFIELKANAQLISKAPEMLEMLKKVLEVSNAKLVHERIEKLIKEATNV